MKTLLFDIEGTTTDIAFVHRVLFPYSFERMEEFVRHHSRHPAIEEVRQVLWQERRVQASLSDVIAALKLWIRTDRKLGALKVLQGEIWLKGYQQGDFQGHVYPDVPLAFARWKQQGHQLAIYSSGSVAAQQQLFAHSVAGDLTGYLSAYFDTTVGGKREITSYQNILRQLAQPPQNVVFFSDIVEELNAARGAGLSTMHVFRGPVFSTDHPALTNFAHLDI